jgi:hypothetical protein
MKKVKNRIHEKIMLFFGTVWLMCFYLYHGIEPITFIVKYAFNTDRPVWKLSGFEIARGFQIFNERRTKQSRRSRE